MKNIFLLLLFSVITNLSSQMVVTYRGGENEHDKRMEYPVKLITTALEITKSEYGNYTLVPSARMNSKRAMNTLIKDTIPNFIVEASVTEENEKNLLSIKIPTTKGLFGYRIFLINKEDQTLFNNINTFEDLKKIRLGQGNTWLDTKILESYKLSVVKGLTYDGLLRMLSSKRFDAFPRGVHEAYKELKNRQFEHSELAIEQNICIYYPLPKFLYTSKNSILLHERISKGLNMMLEDGSFDKIWKEYNYDYVLNAKLNSRKIFKLENPFLPDTVPLNNNELWFSIE